MLNFTFSAKIFPSLGSLFLSLAIFSACARVNTQNLPQIKAIPTQESALPSNDNLAEISRQVEDDLFKQIAASRDDELIKKVDEAVTRKNYRELEKVLKSSSNLDVRDQDGDSLLILMMSDAKAFEMLLAAGANPNFTSLKVGCEYSERCLKPPIHIAFVKNDLTAIRLLLKYKVDPNAESILAWAVSRGNKEMAELLLSYNADANFSNAIGENGQTPIFFAADPKIAELLIAKGADVNRADLNGLTPLMLAAQEKKLEMVRFFIKNGADINAKNAKGETALQQAIAVGDKKIISELKKAGVNK